MRSTGQGAECRYGDLALHPTIWRMHGEPWHQEDLN